VAVQITFKVPALPGWGSDLLAYLTECTEYDTLRVSPKLTDHQIWGYSTGTHLKQPVYLSTWKDFNKEKRKYTEKRLNHRNGEDGRALPFFAAGLCAFSAQAVRMQNVFFLCFKHLSQFQIILDHFRPLRDYFLTMLDHS